MGVFHVVRALESPPKDGEKMYEPKTEVVAAAPTRADAEELRDERFPGADVVEVDEEEHPADRAWTTESAEIFGKPPAKKEP